MNPLDVIDEVTIGGGPLALADVSAKHNSPAGETASAPAHDPYRVIGAVIFDEAEPHVPNSSKDRDRLF